MVSQTIDKTLPTGTSMVRYNAISWYEVEAFQGVLNWSAIDEEAAEIQLIRENGFEPVVILRSSSLGASGTR